MFHVYLMFNKSDLYYSTPDITGPLDKQQVYDIFDILCLGCEICLE